jgi:hypothetical protein
MRQRMLMAVLIGMLGMLGCIASMSAATNTSARPNSYRAAVMRVLNDQGIDYHDVEIVDGCAPSYQSCRTYAGSVRVLATTTLLGQIDCRERWITCTITVPQAGIRAVALDDTIDPLTARWDEFSGQVLRWFQSASRSSSEPPSTRSRFASSIESDDEPHYRTAGRAVSRNTAAARAKDMPTVAYLLNHRPPITTIHSTLLYSFR